MLDTFRAKDKIRISQVIEDTEINSQILDEILKKFNLTENFNALIK